MGDKRERYDKYGLEGVADDGGGGGRGADDLFSMFFGGGGRRSSGPRKGEDVTHPIKVSLEDLYNGKTVKLAIHRQIIVGDSKVCDALTDRELCWRCVKLLWEWYSKFSVNVLSVTEQDTYSRRKRNGKYLKFILIRV